MTKRFASLTLVAFVLAGCGQSIGDLPAHPAPLAAAALPAPAVRVLPGLDNLAPTVSVEPGLVAAAAVVQASRLSAKNMVVADQEAEALDLMAERNAPRQVAFFDDIKKAIHAVTTYFQLSKEVRSALASKDDTSFERLEGVIDNEARQGTAPSTQTRSLANGATEIVMSWNSTFQGDYHIITDRVVDATGVTQALTVTKTGTDLGGDAYSLTRSRTLVAADGTYQVVTDERVITPNGQTTSTRWTKMVHVDGSETITGAVVAPNGWQTSMSGTRSWDGKIQVSLNGIGQENGKPIAVSPGPDAGGTSAADPAATGTASPTPAIELADLTATITAHKDGWLNLGLGKFHCTVTVRNPSSVARTGTLIVDFRDGKSPSETPPARQPLALAAGESHAYDFSAGDADNASVEVFTAAYRSDAAATGAATPASGH